MRPTSPRSADPHEPDSRHVVLVGMMGVGKSSVGRRLALRLDRPFVDTDEMVEKRGAGRTVAEIFKADGEAGFRALEVEAVAQALRSEEPAVVAFGGGAVLDDANRALARERGCVVWLQAPVWDLARRVASSQRRTAAARPLLDSDRSSEEVLAEIARHREDAYRDAAHLEIVTTNRSPGQVATAILFSLGWKAPQK